MCLSVYLHTLSVSHPNSHGSISTFHVLTSSPICSFRDGCPTSLYIIPSLTLQKLLCLIQSVSFHSLQSTCFLLFTVTGECVRRGRWGGVGVPGMAGASLRTGGVLTRGPSQLQCLLCSRPSRGILLYSHALWGNLNNDLMIAKGN